MIEVVFEIIIKFLLVFPGAFIRWMFRGFSGTFKQTLEDTDWITNSIIGGAIIVGCFILFNNFT
jgi:hypothetical protein